MKIGQNIRKVRELKNLTQEYLADKLGLSQNAYSKLERDETEMTLNRLMQLSEVLETNFLDLIGFDADKLFFNQTSHDSSNGIIFTQKIENLKLEKYYDSRIESLEKEIERLHRLLEKALTK